MPIINVKIIENFFPEDQKRALVKELTDAFCRATLEAARPYIYVVIEEVKQGYWGLAGHPLPGPRLPDQRLSAHLRRCRGCLFSGL